MTDKELPRRRDNKIYGSLWLNSERGNVPPLLWIAPLIVLIVSAVGFFGLVFLGWDGTPRVGP
jgi:hypothetical protein